VAPPDPYSITFPEDATGFEPLPEKRLRFPSIVVASTDDPYGSTAFARECAQTWGSRYVEIEGAGHINADSGLGQWKQGRELLRSLANGRG
jgi:predicted alpha/beta hydrolase family esterase